MTRSGRILVWSAAAAIAVYGALLRLDAFVGKYGTLDHPRWARVATHQVAAVARSIRPSRVRWQRESRPYVGGDPITYLKYGREMMSFYQPHVREPVFLAATHVSLWALDGQDAGVSLASAAGSVLMIAATFLLGAALAGPVAGLGAALVVAIEYDLIIWSVDGWRDDTFAAFVVLSAWALLRLRDRPAFSTAITCGVICGLTCLTRITALSFVVPALAWIALERGEHHRARVERTILAAAIGAALVIPYLISCAIASGDPFLAINYHTSYYRFAEGQSIERPMSAGRYIWRKFAAHPIDTTDVGMTGLFVRPFLTKWNGFTVWGAWVRTVLMWSALVGLAVSLFFGRGRLLMLLLLCSLLPYAFTWNVGAGGEWRFTMHAYPLYIAAAMFAIVLSPQLARRRAWRVIAPRAAIVGMVAVVATAVYVAMPWFVVNEAVGLGESVSVETGPRDRVFFRSGWTPPRVEGNVTTRTSREPRAVVHLPLPARGDYDIVLRFDPLESPPDAAAVVLFNQHVAGRLGLATDPGRMGSYRLTLQPAWTKRGDNELALVPASTVGIRLWLVRILPMHPGSH